ncbi:hypothetical protein AVEN_94133-1 [Araneus ventricosus]|uniref:Uncharacterized protein n=1 Tax=Araneus ventricosus TaxID=182803 RepID=A0A4Y2QI13_ARAVE|nr:hypothetical protein AVEN_94133-1 [Araneus ventricosus]
MSGSDVRVNRPAQSGSQSAFSLNLSSSEIYIAEKSQSVGFPLQNTLVLTKEIWSSADETCYGIMFSIATFHATETEGKMPKMSRVRLDHQQATPDNIERVRRMLADDRRLSLRRIAEELKISLDSVSNIIHEHLQKRKKRSTLFRHYSDPATCDNGASSDTERRVC